VACAGSSGKRRRYVPVDVRRAVHARDGARCAFVSADGRRCTAMALLEFDHVRPYARLGEAEASNIRLLCKAHNLLHARHCFGAMHLAAKIAAEKRPGLSGGSR
jgi:predicted restriction endonuclease